MKINLIEIPFNYFTRQLYRNLEIDNIENTKDDSSLEEKKNKFDDYSFIKYCYYFRQFVHEILYREEKVIFIKNNKYEFSYYFYLAKLIESKKNIINYSYDFDLINDLHNSNNNEKKEIKKFVVSKILLILIINYKNNDEINIDNEMENKLKNIEETIIKNMNNFLNNHKEIEIKEISKKIEDISLDLIYFKFIKYLMEKIISEKYEDAYKIIDELDLEKVYVFDTIIEKLSNYFNELLNINNYKIKKLEDLYISKNLNFYYILIKYLFKGIWIYNMPFLMNLRIIIIKAINNKQNNLFFNLNNNDDEEKKKYILKGFLDLDYYNNKYIETLEKKQKENQNFVKDNEILSGQKDSEINITNEKKTNVNKNEEKITSEKSDLIKNFKDWNTLEKRIKDKKIQNITIENKHKLLEYFQDINNKDLLLNIFSLEQIDYLINNFKLYFQKTKLKEILEYYKYYFPESKNKDIILIEQMIKSDEVVDEKYLSDYENALKMNLRKPIIKYLNRNNKFNNEKNIEKEVNKWKEIEKIIINKTIIDSNDKIKEIIGYFQIYNNKKNLIKIFSKEIYDYLIKEIQKIDNKEKKLMPKNFNDSVSVLNEGKETFQSTEIMNKNKKKQIKEYKNENEQKKHEKIKKIINEILTKTYFLIHSKSIKIYNSSDLLTELKYIKNHHKIGTKYYEIKDYIMQNPEDMISAIKIKNLEEFIKDVIERIKNQFKLDYILKIKLEFIKNKEKSDDDISNFSCKYIFYTPNGKEISYIENSILENKTNSNSEGFNVMLSDINDKKYRKFENSNKSNSIFYNSGVNTNNIYEKSKTGIFADDKNDIGILTYDRIIGNHQVKMNNYTAENIKELSNNYFISYGIDKKIKIYDKDNFKEIPKTIECQEWIYAICEKIGNKEDKHNSENKIQIIACTNKEMILFTLTFKKDNKIDSESQQYELTGMTCVNCIQMEYNNFVIIGLSKAYFINNLFDKEKHENIVNKATYRDAIKINDKLIAMTSNKVAVEGEDNLILYNTNSTDIKKLSSPQDERRYSFNFSTDSMAIITSKKFLLCACKKYFPNQENGIFFFNPELEFENDNSEKKFYKTENFEVFCFCPLYDIIQTNNKFEKETEYFLVGGFDNDKGEGLIKLFKFIYNKTDIEFIQDIEFEKNGTFKGFEGPINSLIQSKCKGNILATCYDGNVHLFSPLNVDLIRSG